MGIVSLRPARLLPRKDLYVRGQKSPHAIVYEVATVIGVVEGSDTIQDGASGANRVTLPRLREITLAPSCNYP